MSPWGGVGATGGGRDFGGEVVYFVDGQEDGLFSCAVVVQGALDDVFNGESREGGKALFAGGVGVVVYVGVPINVVGDYGVFVLVVVVVGIGTRWCGGRGPGVGRRVFLGFVGILDGVGAGWGFGGILDGNGAG